MANSNKPVVENWQLPADFVGKSQTGAVVWREKQGVKSNVLFWMSPAREHE